MAERAEAYLAKSGIADVAYFGPEAEFFIFTSARWGEGMNTSFYEVDSDEGPWNTGKNGGSPNLAYRPRVKEGYFPTAPMDKLHDLRATMVATLMSVGVDVEVHHHEVGAAGQAEIDMRFKLAAAHGRQLAGVQVHHQERGAPARLHGHVHAQAAVQGQRLRDALPPEPVEERRQPVLRQGWLRAVEQNGAQLHRRHLEARALTAGLLRAKHEQLSAAGAGLRSAGKSGVFGAQSVGGDSYSDVQQPARRRSVSSSARRIRSANPYLAFAAMLMAGLDGIENEIDPGKPADYDLYLGNGHKTPTAPGSLHESLDALLKDHAYLLKGDVFTKDLIEKYYEYKWVNEADAVAMRPHPYEFDLYFDA